jgi:ABC-type antimicrobial peptide transport system permease subunit
MRTRELGIRRALGAPVGSLVRDVITQGAVLAAVGIGAGLAAWYLLVPALAGTMAGAGRADPTVPVLVAVLVGGAALIASLGPALRSARVDPAIALQAE